MKKTKILHRTLVLGFVLICSIPTTGPAAEGAEVGANAPFFRIKSGNDEELTLDSVKGKITVIFYETREVAEKNRRLKAELKKSYQQLAESQKASIVRLPVINCSSAFWPISGIWKSKLRENTIKEGLTIYGDWDGKMVSDYRMKDNESNIVMIDKKGVIRYFWSGKVEDGEINKIKDMVKELLYEK